MRIQRIRLPAGHLQLLQLEVYNSDGAHSWETAFKNRVTHSYSFKSRPKLQETFSGSPVCAKIEEDELLVKIVIDLWCIANSLRHMNVGLVNRSPAIVFPLPDVPRQLSPGNAKANDTHTCSFRSPIFGTTNLPVDSSATWLQDHPQTLRSQFASNP